MDERRDKNRIRFAEQEREVRHGQAAPAGARGGSAFGAWLRAQREARGVTIDDIAESSKISRRYLEALETDRFDALPAPVFVRGFLREYARIAGLDPDEVVNFYLLARPQPVRERMAAAAGAPGPQTAAQAPSGRLARIVGYGVLLLALLALFVGVAMAISWWAGQRAARAGAAAPAGGAVRTAPARAPAPEPLREPAAESPEVRSDVAPSAAAAAEPQPAGGGPASAADRLHVVLEFQQDCWVEVVVDGRRRESELKAGGETLALEADSYVLLTLGNGPAVRVEVDGEPFPLPTQGSRVVRELRIDRAALAARGAAAAATAPQ